MGNPRVVTITGGSGGKRLLQALRDLVIDPTAIVTVFDDGGSTGRIMKEFEAALALGDIRQCLEALATVDGLLMELFCGRFTGEGIHDGYGIGDHALGNLFLLQRLQHHKYDALRAIEDVSTLLGVGGRVLPVSQSPAVLQAILNDGARVVGESMIGTRPIQDRRVITDLMLDPVVPMLPQAASAVREAHVVIIGPGDLYTSLIPNLLVEGFKEAFQISSAKFVFVASCMTRAAETRGRSVSWCAQEILKYAGRARFDHVLVNNGPIPEAVANRYWRSEEAEPMQEGEFTSFAAPSAIIRTCLLDEGELAKGNVRHDPHKLRAALQTVFEELW